MVGFLSDLFPGFLLFSITFSFGKSRLTSVFKTYVLESFSY